MTLAEDVIFTRAIDGTGSQHACSREDDGAIAWVRKEAYLAALDALEKADELLESLLCSDPWEEIDKHAEAYRTARGGLK